MSERGRVCMLCKEGFALDGYLICDECMTDKLEEIARIEKDKTVEEQIEE